MTKMREYEFTLKLIGVGQNPEEAWGSILEMGVYRPVMPDEYYMPNEYEVINEWEDDDC